MREQVHNFLLRPPWWIWPAFLLLVAILADVSAAILVPKADELCHAFGIWQFGGECDFTRLTGLPCPQCGMTRSFAWGIRLNWIKAFFYNPAGFALFLWLNVSGIIGAARLWTRNPNKLEMNPWAFISWILFWLVGLYGVGYALRLYGINALP